MKVFKGIYKEENEYMILSIYKNERKGQIGKKIAELKQEKSGFSTGGRIDSLLMVLLNSMQNNLEHANLFSNSEFEITYKDTFTGKVIKHVTKNQSIINEFKNFCIELF